MCPVCGLFAGVCLLWLLGSVFAHGDKARQKKKKYLRAHTPFLDTKYLIYPSERSSADGARAIITQQPQYRYHRENCCSASACQQAAHAIHCVYVPVSRAYVVGLATTNRRMSREQTRGGRCGEARDCLKKLGSKVARAGRSNSRAPSSSTYS